MLTSNHVDVGLFMKPRWGHFVLNSTPGCAARASFCAHCTRNQNFGDTNTYLVYDLVVEILPVVKLKGFISLASGCSLLRGSTYIPPVRGPPRFSQRFYSSQPFPTTHPWWDREAYFWWGVAGAWLNGLWPNPPGPPMLVPCHGIHKYLMPALSRGWR